MEAIENGISRRGFLGLGAVATAVAGMGLAGCAPQTTAESSKADASDENDAASGIPSWLGEEPVIDESEIGETVETGVLIVGAGNAGMACAASCSDLGLDFMVCEKNGAVEAARGFIGLVNTHCTRDAGVEVDEMKLLNEISRYASFKNNQAVAKTWIRESAEVLDWLDGIMEPLGLKATLCTHEHLGDGGTDYYIPCISHVYVANPDVAPGSDLEAAGSIDFPVDWSRNAHLEEYIKEAGHEVSFGCRLVKIEREENGRVTGAIFETDSGYKRVNASLGVALCTGGYAANPAMVRALNPILTQCITGNAYTPSTTGDGIKAGIWAGGVLESEPAPMIFNRGMVMPGVNAGYTDDSETATFNGTIGQNGIGSQPFMKVSRRGKRFANESTPYDDVCFAATNQEGGVWCMVFDANAPADVKRFATIGCSTGGMWMVNFDSVDEWIEGISSMMAADVEPIMRADTLDELADKLGFAGEDKENFLAECEHYNEMFDAQKDDEFGKEAYRLSELRTPPFYGAWFGGSLLTTLQGLRIDEDMRVLDANRKPIEGLFAAGDCSGSMFSGNYPELLVASACGRTVTFGRHIARYLAGDLD